MSERVVLRIYDPLLTTLRDTLTDADYEFVRFSDEAGGAGGINFTVPTALVTDPDDYDDAVVLVDIDDGAGGYALAPYAIRAGTSHQQTIGQEKISCSGKALLTAWGTDATVRPEFTATGAMPRGAGEQRHLSWAGSLYDPADDPDEPWDAVKNSPRGTGDLPTEPPWPTGAGATWTTVAGTADGARKFLRAWLTISAADTTVRCYFSADETSQVIIGGQPVLQTDTVEVGKVNTHKMDMVLQPGTYAVAVDTVTHVSKGGDGSDPILLAICELDDDGENGSWLLVSNENTFVACRRQIIGEGSQPPGPTPGDIVLTLLAEAVERRVSGWPSVATSFTPYVDSDGLEWTTKEERIHRYAMDTYTQVWDGLGDVACDMRMTHAGTALTLEARVFEGVDKTSVVVEAAKNVERDSDITTGVRATTVDSYTVDGWITVEATPGATGRREMGLSLGTAPSISQGRRIGIQALDELAVKRTDNDVSFVAEPGCIPYVDFRPGDTITRRRRSGDRQQRVLSLAGVGSNPVRWSAELGEAFL